MHLVIYTCAIYINVISVVFGQLNPPVFIGQNTPAVPSRLSDQWLDPNFQIPSIPTAQSNNEQSWQSNGNQFSQTPTTMNQFGQVSPNTNNFGAIANNFNQFGRRNNAQFRPVNTRPFQRLGNQFGPNGTPFQTILPNQNRPWAPGQPRWVFPNGPFRESCQRRGCPMQGTHCVFLGGLCPTSVRRTPCRCERGCRVDTHFIAFGQTKVMDQCNNVCRCTSREGIAQCTTRRC